MKVDNVSLSGLYESIVASGYAMKVDNMNAFANINPDDLERAERLGNTPKGSGHDQFLTGINVSFDLTCTNKMWVELERYRFIFFVTSQSTMHRIAKLDIKKQCNKYVWDSTMEKLETKCKEYNELDDKTTDYAKELYLEILYNVPSGFELTARLTTNYRALKTVYSQRNNHRLPEWRDFCKWIEELPYFKSLVLGGGINAN